MCSLPIDINKRPNALDVFSFKRIIVVMRMLLQVAMVPDHSMREIRRADSGFTDAKCELLGQERAGP